MTKPHQSDLVPALAPLAYAPRAREIVAEGNQIRELEALISSCVTGTIAELVRLDQTSGSEADVIDAEVVDEVGPIDDRTRGTAGEPYASNGAARLVVQPNRDIVLVGDADDPRERLSELTTETFYAPDLNKIAAEVKRNQQSGVESPADPKNRLFVDNDGNIFFGDEAGQDRARLSEITQETFYGRVATDAEERVVRQKLPKNAQWATDGDYGGWVFTITNEFADSYTLFLWLDPADRLYKVSLIDPDLRGQVSVHDCHLYSDGTLCLRHEHGPGYPELERTFARAALWTRGASFYRRGYGFNFSYDGD